MKNIRRFLLIFLRTLSQVASSLGLSQLFLTDVSSSSLNRLLSSSSINDSTYSTSLIRNFYDHFAGIVQSVRSG